MPSRVSLVALVFALAGVPRVAPAQAGRFSPYPELRADVIAAPHAELTGGAGLELPFGAYVRLGLDASAGAFRHDDETVLGARGDVIGRFLLDPFREVPVGLSLGAGLTLPVEQHSRAARPLLVAVIDVEGRRRGAWSPALQLGLGGGVRAGFVLRHSPKQSR